MDCITYKKKQVTFLRCNYVEENSVVNDSCFYEVFVPTFLI